MPAVRGLRCTVRALRRPPRPLHDRTPASRRPPLQDLFQHTVLATPWDTLSARERGGAFTARLPPFSYDLSSKAGCNTIVIFAESFALAGTETFFLETRVGADAAMLKEILLHATMRGDKGGMPGQSSVRRRYLQGYKLNDGWHTEAQSYREGDAFPIVHGNKFWWRLVIHPMGYFTYVNGSLIKFTPHAPGRRPHDFDPLFFQLPIMGGSGEVATMRVHGVWWGAFTPSAAEEAAAGSILAAKFGKTPTWVLDKVRVSGLPPETGPEEVTAAFAAYGASACVRDAAPGAFVVTLRDQLAQQLALDARGTIKVRDTAAVIARPLTDIAAASAAAGGGAVGGAGVS